MTIWIVIMLLTIVVLAPKLKSKPTPARRTRQRSPVGRRIDAPKLTGTGDFDFEIVGEASYQRNIASFCPPKSKDGVEIVKLAVVTYDDNNRYDKNAVAVSIDGKLVGYLARDIAKDWRKSMKAKFPGANAFLCSAMIRGGWDDLRGRTGNYGVFLDIDEDKYL